VNSKEKTTATGKHPGAVSLGKRRMELLTTEERQAFAQKGGKSRLKTMPAKQRKAIARKAAAARWAKKAK
jgi:hypothetical protein